MGAAAAVQHVIGAICVVCVQEHCLMGIKGTVRRSTDGDFIHANVDIDLIITEEPEIGNIEKPVEIFHIIEHFCLGRRRLHLFGRDSTIRPGNLIFVRYIRCNLISLFHHLRVLDRGALLPIWSQRGWKALLCCKNR